MYKKELKVMPVSSLLLLTVGLKFHISCFSLSGNAELNDFLNTLSDEASYAQQERLVAKENEVGCLHCKITLQRKGDVK